MDDKEVTLEKEVYMDEDIETENEKGLGFEDDVLETTGVELKKGENNPGFSTLNVVLVFLVTVGVCLILAFSSLGAREKEDTDTGKLPDEKEYSPPWHGPWEKYIKAPKDKSHILPKRIYKVRGNVSTSVSSGRISEGDEFDQVTGQGQGDGILIGLGGSLTVEFEENIGGMICFDIDSLGGGGGKHPVVVITLGYSESPWYAGPIPDATTDRQERDLPLRLKLSTKRKGKVCVGKDFVRGSFKYFTVSLPGARKKDVVEGDGKRKRKRDRPWVRIKSIWAVCTAYPSMEDGRKYTGYFYSSSDLLNRIWYAGAWTLQLSTIDPQEGSSLIDYNRIVDHNQSPTGSWYSNFTISNGTSVTTDGAKRDRVVWPGDMYIAIPGIAVSTNDMLSVRNALDVLYDHQYEDGSLPYAGPPMGYHGEFSDTYHLHTLLGTYYYALYTGNLDYLRSRWNAYLRALNVSISKVDEMGLLHVSSVSDWLRPGLTGHNLEASTILYTVLEKSISLASWLSENSPDISTHHDTLISSWKSTQQTIETGLSRLYCPSTGLFSDNIGARSCKGPNHIDPQDGNSWVLISKINLDESNRPFRTPKSGQRTPLPLDPGTPSPKNISTNLGNRWNKFGAPAPEFPNVISPFASGFELLGHCASGNIPTAVELILLEWGYLLDGPGFTNSTLAEGFRVDGDMQYPAYPSTARNSHAHGWSSGPTSVVMGEVVGIEVTVGGVDVHPRLTGWLGWLRGGFETRFGWAEVRIWRVGEWGVDKGGDEDGGYGMGVRRGYWGVQKPIMGRLGVVRNGRGERMKNTGRKGVVVEIEVPEVVEGGTVRLGGLLEDLWEYEYGRGEKGVSFDDVRGDWKWDFDISSPAVFHETGRGRKMRIWLRWEDVGGLDGPLGLDGDETKMGETRRVGRSGKWEARVVFLPLQGERVKGKEKEKKDTFREPIEVDNGEGGEMVMLRFDEDFKPLEMDTTRKPGVVDWDVMEGYFRTEVYPGWSIDHLKEEAEKGQLLEEENMEEDSVAYADAWLGGDARGEEVEEWDDL